MKNRFAAEDERAAREDIERQQAWFDETKADRDALVAQKEELTEDDGTILAANQAEANQLQGEIDSLNGDMVQLEGAIGQFKEELAR